MKAGQFVSGLVAGSVAGVALGALMSPGRSRKAVMRRGRRLWAKRNGLW